MNALIFVGYVMEERLSREAKISLIIGLSAMVLISLYLTSTFISIQAQWMNKNHEPVVTLIYPKGGEELTGKVEIRWSASDPDGDPLIVSLQYTSDPPQFCPSCPTPTWHYIAFGLDNTGLYIWNTAMIPDGSYRIRVIVSDGRSEGIAISTWISINNTKSGNM